MSFSSRDENCTWSELLEFARAGNDAAFMQLCERFREYLTTIAQSELRQELQSKVGTSDLIQESMLEAWSEMHCFRGSSEGEFRLWIARLFRHNLIDQARKYRKTQSRNLSLEIRIDQHHHQNILESNELSGSRIMLLRENDEMLLRAVNQLPEKQKSVILLKHENGLSYEEIAEQMNVKATAIRKIWSRAIQTLRSEIVGD
ncbi:RNA polymerase sigma factor [Rubinisphaera italica]|uniref:ECF RNA polymerase sigma-E factor n=1 Tax=Rubinisphaera italica TaxID=2527969 RepID=A0A5C5XHS4_9PLAN|nr:sigma-70 family RNA polymerase sigma factor [Rubinisphaera italica]TWT61422.1 ECF RNA polymerase sigma-E factor [Rubinisphaera italica]